MLRQVYIKGESTHPEGLPVVAPKDIQNGHEYIFEYKTPAFAYSFVSEGMMASFIESMFELRNNIKALDPNNQALLRVTGVYVDTETGIVRLRAVVTFAKPTMQAGINPLALLAVVGGLFAAIGVGVSLLYVYEVGQELGIFSDTESGSSSTADPCTEKGITASIRCAARKTKWVGIGVGIGALAVLLYLLLKQQRGSMA